MVWFSSKWDLDPLIIHRDRRGVVTGAAQARVSRDYNKLNEEHFYLNVTFALFYMDYFAGSISMIQQVYFELRSLSVPIFIDTLIDTTTCNLVYKIKTLQDGKILNRFLTPATSLNNLQHLPFKTLASQHVQCSHLLSP